MCDVNSNVGRQRDLPESRGKGQAWKREREGLMTRPHGRGRAPDVRVEDIRRESRRVHPRSRWRSLVCPPAGQRPPRRWHRPVPAGRGFPAGTAGLGRGCREEITLKKGLGRVGGRAPTGPAGEARSTAVGSRHPAQGRPTARPGLSSGCSQEGRQAAGRSGAPPWPGGRTSRSQQPPRLETADVGGGGHKAGHRACAVTDTAPHPRTALTSALPSAGTWAPPWATCRCSGWLAAAWPTWMASAPFLP